MAKLDRLGWAAGIAFVSHGLRIGVRVSDGEVMADVKARIPFGWKKPRSLNVDAMCSVIVGSLHTNGKSRRFHLVYLDNALVGRSLSWVETLDLAEKSLRHYVSEFSTRSVFVHAGVVGWRGKAIVIPGMSHAGKSTLVAELVRQGATYYSDEFAVLDARGHVHPYAVPIQLRDCESGGERRVTAVELGGSIGRKPLKVGWVLATQFKPGARWQPRTMSTGHCVLSVMAHTVSARRQPEKAMATLHAALASARALKGFRGEAHDVVNALKDHLV